MKIFLRHLSVSVQSLAVLVVIASCVSLTTAQPSKTPPTFTKPAWLSCSEKDLIEKTILYEYGAVFLSEVFVKHPEIRPAKCYMNESEVDDYLKTLSTAENKLDFGGFYLHSDAKRKLLKVFEKLGGYREVARNFNGTTESKRSAKKDLNDDWAQRDFSDTENNWKFGLARKDIEKVIKNSYPSIYFAAIPGSSQHHFGLAIDVNNGKSNFDIKKCKQYQNCKICDEKCEKVLNKNGWFRTVRYDAFHFTYLGWDIEKLPEIGLKKVSCKDKNLDKEFIYWVPNMKEENGGCKDV